MKKSAFALVPAVALGAAMLGSAAPAMADSQSSWSYEAQLHALNNSGGTGVAMVTLKGDQVTVDAKVSGLAMKFNGNAYPHVAHIHDMGSGECPMPSADKNGDGVISTPEGAPAYGGIGATLTTSGDTSPKSALDLKRAFGMGGSFNYHRTFTLDAATLAEVKKDNAVIVVHGLDPAKLSAKAQKEDSSPLTKDLPLAATAPALCGPLHATQMSGMPTGAAGTGGGMQTSTTNDGMLAGGLALLLGSAAAFVASRRVAAKRAR
ncbi:CHRD domain-containing protein [Amnibacterium sp. CER49]|uniref:CHRD domain-containing protein n=1 Tax=Amnibacterium sp. CER49 TaxID=3039161 RepID=UPI002449688A|nr:CHRD domain-containing protein [Amnibacterium sp. CER49]MDH2442644.1 CHRD domain-containing protein [Amnibacterium sp. CER49]